MREAPAERAVRLRTMYDNLARYQWLQRRLRRCAPGEGLEMHKTLVAAEGRVGPAAGTAGLHAWVWERFAPTVPPRVLDVGCGFGASLLTWARAHAGEFVGLTLSAVQVARARAQALALGVADRCTFRVQAYDQPIDGHFDRVVAIEALCHSDALGAALTCIAGSTAAGGRLVAIEDVAVDDGVAAEPDGSELRARWSTPHLYSEAAWRAALGDAGFDLRVVHDLTPQVRPRPDAVLVRATRSLRWLRAALPTRGSRAVADAFLGGVALERLYRKGSMRYLAFEAERMAS